MWSKFVHIIVLLLTITSQSSPEDNVKIYSHDCDFTFYQGNDYTICRDNLCEEVVSSTFRITVGGTVCLVRDDETLIKFQLLHAYRVYEYRLMYETCTLQRTLTPHFRCFWAGACDYTSCKQDYDQDRSVDPPSPRPTIKGSFKYFTGCSITGKCKGWCGYDQDTRCGWGLLEIIPHTCLPVYRITAISWVLNLVKMQDDSHEQIQLSSSNPFMIDPYPMSVNNFLIQTPEYKGKDSLIQDGKGVYHFVSSSMRDQPIPGSIGDVQRSIVDKTFILPPTAFTCSMDFCHFRCKYPQVTMERLGYINGTEKSFVNVEVTKSEQGNVLTHYQLVQGNVELVANTGKVKGIIVKNPECELGVLSAVGCTECNDQSLIYIGTTNLVHTGIIEFTSNCKFDTSFLRCQKQPYILRGAGDNKCCNITYITKMNNNQTSLSFCTNYLFSGSLHQVNILTGKSHNDDFFETGKLLFSSPNFINGLFYTGGLVTVSLAIIRVGSILIISWFGRKEVKTSST